VLERFPKARGVAVHMADAEGEFVPEMVRVRATDGPAPSHEQTIVRRAVERRELVAYAAGQGPPRRASVMGVAGAVLVPLLAPRT
jgi:succinyl-CoA synthetase alpha subunit